jgi:hypothetical protein
MALSTVPVAFKEGRNFRVSLIGGTATAVRHSGGTNLSERKWLVIQNASANPVYIGFRMTSGTDTNMSAYELAKFGLKLKAGAVEWLPISDTLTPYARLHTSGTGASAVNNGFLRVMELA